MILCNNGEIFHFSLIKIRNHEKTHSFHLSPSLGEIISNALQERRLNLR